ncbi:MAG TPA: NUMOD3 domain-containing DNA-binding protein [Nitrososphaeraceae archaeon]|nr:NUMOD3 domain-containing DNA-binding protein [Nitrososphaeraceae archaeon]
MTNKNCGIYKITSPSGKIYIGQGVNIKRRFNTYKKLHCKNQPVLHRSFLKYGVENHQFDIIEYCTEDELNCSERFWQDEFDVIGKNGLNGTLQDCGEKLRVISEETLQKMSDSQKGDKNHFYGKTHSEETKELIRKARENFIYTDELRHKISQNTTMGKNPNAKKVVDIKTGQEYSCVKEACKAIGIGKKLLSEYLKGDRENKTNLEYSDISLRPRSVKYSYKNILVLDLSNGVYYYSIKEASKYYGIHKTTLSEMLSGNIMNKTSLLKC